MSGAMLEEATGSEAGAALGTGAPQRLGLPVVVGEAPTAPPLPAGARVEGHETILPVEDEPIVLAMESEACAEWAADSSASVGGREPQRVRRLDRLHPSTSAPPIEDGCPRATACPHELSSASRSP